MLRAKALTIVCTKQAKWKERFSKNDLEMASGKKNSDYAQLQAAIAAHKEVAIMRGYLEIRAPFDGVVAARNVNLGTFVGRQEKVQIYRY
jgi:multidrug resistance efflux pump